MKKSILKYKYILLILAVFAAGFIYWSLPVSNVVYAQTYGVVADDGVAEVNVHNNVL